MINDVEHAPIIRLITTEQALPIRHRVLWPDKSIDDCRVEDDSSGEHFGAFIGDDLVCVASIFQDEEGVRLRKFATLPEYQGKGIGSLMLAHIIDKLNRSAVIYFWCDARESAQAFYGKFGMAIQGERFYKADIAYRKMSLALKKTV
ncbi:GNAT family N-acetyltransferase [Marinomonas transparens]|uniref:GNAT family N-acetyltransferase n=1 Tax=Marinomonas transparens TaxID=2795388 RepID=UPI001F27A1F4|nr:GNAT family N-acetyltransferase [Marinomonas transparens]